MKHEDELKLVYKDGNLLLSASWLTGANLPSGSTIKMKNATGCNFPLNNFSTLDPALVSSSSEICAGSKVEHDRLRKS